MSFKNFQKIPVGGRQAHKALERLNGEPSPKTVENGKWGLEMLLGGLAAGTAVVLISFAGGEGTEPQRHDAPLPDGASAEFDPTEDNPYDRLMQIHDNGGPQTEEEQQEFGQLMHEIHK